MASLQSFIIPGLQELEKLQDRLQKALGEDFRVEIDTDITGSLGLNSCRFDLAIFFNEEPIAAIEYKSIKDIFNIKYQAETLARKFEEIGIKYGVIYFWKSKDEGSEFHLFRKGHLGLEKISFDGLIKAIAENREFGSRPLVDEVYVDLMDSMPEELFDSIPHDSINNLFKEDTLVFDENRGVVSLKSEFEDQLFKILLPHTSHNELCRYTSLKSLFLLMRNKEHCLCSITCMNDKGEISYADEYVSYGATASSFLSVDNNNNCFILSCCDQTKSDDLKMWRLYADNAKGACIEYSIDYSKIDNEHFFLAPVSYGQSQNCHYELDFIKGIRNWRKDGWRFELKRWNIWKHFFKSYIFADEKEIRLMYVPEEGSHVTFEWIMDSTNSIVSRICLFKFKDNMFPLKLKSALIGPKCPEQTSNVDQFNYMNMKQAVFPTVRWKEAIRASQIQDYR